MIPECVEIPPGKFLFGGSPNDKFVNATECPATEVIIGHAFFLTRDPITGLQWSACPHFSPVEKDPALPITRVSWDDAVAYSDWLSESSGEIWRLPNEREWEYACRAGSTDPFSTGDSISPDQANFLYEETGERIGLGRLTAPGHFPSNAFGLNDMHGNVCEWTIDSWCSSYDSTDSDPDRKTIRGGSWDYLPRMLRSSWRDGVPRETRRDNLGFRLLKELR